MNRNKLHKDKLIQALKEPYIFHFKIHIKPWYGIAKKNGMICFDFFPRFYEYARKTDYYFEILENFRFMKKKFYKFFVELFELKIGFIFL